MGERKRERNNKRQDIQSVQLASHAAQKASENHASRGQCNEHAHQF